METDSMFVRRSLSLFVAAVCLLGAPLLLAQESGRQGLPEVVGQLAESVRKVAAKLDQSAVRIGHFSPFGIDESNAGGAFMAELDAALKDFVKPDAALELQGTYGFIESPGKPGLKVIVVRAKLIRVSSGADEKEFRPFEAYIRSGSDIAKIIGATVSFKPDSEYKGPPSEGRNKDLQKSLPPGPGKPPAVQAHIHGKGNTLVSASPESQYAVEIRTVPLADFRKEAARARKVELKNGLPFVPIDKGEVYEVRVQNFSKHEVAVSLAIDGIDQFTFSEDRRADGRPRFSHFLVGPSKDGKPGEVVIPGWHRTVDPKRNDNFLAFLVTEYGKGAASRFPTKSRGKVGTITVGFALSYPPGSRSGSETGFGPPVKVEQKVEKRDIDAPHEFVTVRYQR
jgi:hypothetical protein